MPFHQTTPSAFYLSRRPFELRQLLSADRLVQLHQTTQATTPYNHVLLFSVVIPAKAGTQKTILTDKQPAVYIVASKRNDTLYVGVTSN